MLKRKLTHLEAHAIAHRLRQAGEVVAGVVEELVGMDDPSPDREQVGESEAPHPGLDSFGNCLECGRGANVPYCGIREDCPHNASLSRECGERQGVAYRYVVIGYGEREGNKQ